MESELRRHLSFEVCPGLIGVHDLEGTIRYMNPAAAKALGYAPEELSGRNFVELIVPSVAPYFSAAMDRLREEKTGEGLVLIRTRDGERRRWWYRHTLIEPPGLPPLVLGDSTDITDVLSTSEALQESEQRFQYLAENIHQVFWLRDPRTSQILYLSPAFERVWGRPRDWMIDQPWLFLETIHADDRLSLLDAFARSAAGEATAMEYRVVQPDGSERWIASHAFPVRDSSGEVARIVAITEDISERKLAEENLRLARDRAEAATAEKSLLLANVSHEVRTPLNIIFGLTEMLLDGDLSDEQRDNVGRIVKMAHALNHLAGDLLEFSKIGSRTLELQHEPFEPAAIVQLALQSFLPAREGVVLESEIASNVPARLTGDPDRLRQVITNLVGNASKFTERGRIRVSIDLAGDEPPHVILRCRVQDTGRGIAVEDQQRIFEPFSQAYTGTAHDRRGFGLGLAICAEIVRWMGGEISVASTLGEGSTFTFTACLTRSTEVAAAG